MAVGSQMNLTPMDSVRAAIINAMLEDMTVIDLWMCAEHAETSEDFDTAVNELAQAVPSETTGQG